jgi:polyisoprenoid-binding protein YceI
MNTTATSNAIAIWGIDNAHSEIGFKVKHLMITSVKGSFKEFNATVTTEGEGMHITRIGFSMNTASVDTRDAQRDAHLRSADFFDADNHKEVTFIATTDIDAGKTPEFTLEGDLTIRGVTKKISLDVEFTGMVKDPWGNMKAGFVLEGKINRKDFGLNWNAALEAGGWLVGDDVKILCEVQLFKQAAN